MRFSEGRNGGNEKINEKITIGNGKTMMATKWANGKDPLWQENGELIVQCCAEQGQSCSRTLDKPTQHRRMYERGLEYW